MLDHGNSRASGRGSTGLLGGFIGFEAEADILRLATALPPPPWVA